ncbi:hypothetical protein KSP39_PZI001883 [Platanthera zijinensis]|uniref:Uncharacterized protein n=1 Tax=Platanthera zijinensis TaxID=2320716 RepID=A0AAP0BZG2_9ASPA
MDCGWTTGEHKKSHQIASHRASFPLWGMLPALHPPPLVLRAPLYRRCSFSVPLRPCICLAVTGCRILGRRTTSDLLLPGCDCPKADVILPGGGSSSHGGKRLFGRSGEGVAAAM